MTHVSARAVAVLLEREARQQGALDLATAIRRLRDQLGVPDHRIRTALAISIEAERLDLIEDTETGRPVLRQHKEAPTVNNKFPALVPCATPGCKSILDESRGPTCIGCQKDARDENARLVRQGGASNKSGVTTASPTHLAVRKSGRRSNRFSGSVSDA